jgi:predicted CXXCH cytochrome family protein
MLFGVLAIGFAVSALALALRPTTFRLASLLVAATALTGAAGSDWLAARARRGASLERLVAAVPELGRESEGYVGSDTCQSCHPGEYASWHRSYHRTMTTLATPTSIRGPFAGQTLVSRGRSYELSQRGDEYWVRLVDPDWERDERLAGRDPDGGGPPPPVERRVVMATGSHLMQTYWVEGRHGNEVYNLPFVFLFEQNRFVPREDVFLRPPAAGRFFAVWNNSCIECHSTAGKVGFQFQEEVFRSAVGEIGIACEACHGPAQTHIDANRNPLRRYELHLGEDADPTIVQPQRLSSQASSQVCGQCHGIGIAEELDWLENGHRFRPGEQLEENRFIVRPAVDRDSEALRELMERDPSALPSRFWPDGMVRVSGREYNAMIESDCFQRGELSCLSCHSMHNSDPNDQLAAGMDGNAACLQCHEDLRSRVTQHTRHSATSAGSACMNCHMPHTVYGLLKGIRSHWIDSPRVATTLATGRPNACNSCHLDRPLAWTAEHLEEWYGQAQPQLGEDDRRYSATLLALLRGDAGQRALAAWSFGWEPAQHVSGRGWIAPYLAHLLEDPYSTVRYIAGRSLATLPEYRGIDFDFLDSPSARSQARRRALDVWFDLPLERVDRRSEAVLIDGEGNPLHVQVARLASQRDDRPVVLNE